MANPYTQGGPGEPTAKAIEWAVANFFRMRVTQLHRNRTLRETAAPRLIAMYLMKQMTDAPVCEIAQYFGNKYSSQVERSIAKLEEQRYKKHFLNLVICELLEHAELRVTREERRIRQRTLGRGEQKGSDRCPGSLTGSR